jgi:hypothetical protein
VAPFQADGTRRECGDQRSSVRIWSSGWTVTKCYSSCYSCSEYWGHFMSVGVAQRRETNRGIWRQIFEKVGKTLKRNGGDDGARTRFRSLTVVVM